MLATRFSGGACSSNTRGVYAGGNPSGSNVIQYITMATLGNATDFGDSTATAAEWGGTSNNIRGVFGSANAPSAPYRFNHIDYITIASTANAAAFGDLTTEPSRAAAMGDAHGGLG